MELRSSIEEDQRLLVQWAEEKMSLACIMSDLLDMHVIQLDKDLQGLESELEVGIPRHSRLSLMLFKLTPSSDQGGKEKFDQLSGIPLLSTV